jgi:antirestriction protein
MTVTLTANYKETLKAETVELIDELLEDNYELSDILEFIDENSEDDFVTYYIEYVEQGENLGYDVVDAFVEENGFCDVESCGDAYVGCYVSGADFAEEYSNDCGDRVPDHIIVDWEATWDRSLSYDFDAVEKGYRQVYIFRRYY